MSNLTDRVTKHPTFAAIEEVQKALGAATDKVVDSKALESLDRLRAVAYYTRARLESIDPLLIPPMSLNQFPVHLNGIGQGITQFVADGSTSHLQQANNHADRLLRRLNEIPVAPGSPEISATQTVLTRLRTDTEELLASLLVRTQSLEKSVSQEIESLVTEMRAARAQMSSLASDFQRQFSEAQDRRSSEHTEIELGRDKEWRAALEQQRTIFELTLATEREEQAKVFSAAKAEFAETSAKLETRIASIVDDATNRAAVMNQTLDQHVQAAEKLVGLMGDRGVISGYHKTSAYFRKVGWFWNGVTVLALSALAFAIIYFFSGSTGAPSGESAGARLLQHLPLFITLGALATYAGYETAKAQRIEVENQKLELDLTALRPFLAGLHESELNTFRLKVADRVFGRGFDPDTISASPATLGGGIMKGAKADKLLLEIVDHIIKGLK